MSGEQLIEGVDYVLENGLFVLTRSYLLKRGYCCDQGCRNCPYEKPKTKHDRREGDSPDPAATQKG